MRRRHRYLARAVLLAATLTAALWLGTLATTNPAVQGLIKSGGYLGVFLFSIISGFNVLVPVVPATFVPALVAAGLNPFVLISVIVIGVSLADMTTFHLARAGRVHLSEDGRIMRAVEAAEAKWQWLPLLILVLWAALVPLPNELVLVPLGLMGYRTERVLPMVILGNIIFNVAVAFGAAQLIGMM